MKMKYERKLEHYKERKQENDLDLKTKMPKWMKNTSFYRPKRTIHLVINYWISGLGGLDMDLFSGQNDISTIRIWHSGLHESCRNLSHLSTKREWAHLDFYNSRYELNTKHYLGCRTDSNFFFVVKMWTSKWQNWVLDSAWMF
jgi:hypothetical protein